MIRYIWQLPQHLLALLLLVIYRPRIVSKELGIVRIEGILWGISLGQYIFVREGASDRTVKHEQGHSRQSLLLGPLYLLIVGLPSFMMALLTTLRILKAKDYYKRWPENWADKLGGVKR